MAQASIQDAWRTYIQEGRNLREESRKQIESFVKRLVKEGQVRSDQVQGTVDDIQKRSEKALTDFRKRVRGVIQDELTRVGVATKSDIDRIERKIGRVEKQVAEVKRVPTPAGRSRAGAGSSTPKKTSTGRARASTTKRTPARRSSSTKKK